MLRQEVAIVILVTVFIIACVWVYYRGPEMELKCIVATEDGNKLSLIHI